MADPEPAVGTDGGARPVARDRHVAAAGELGPGIGVRIEGPQVVEEGRARLAGEDHEADVVDPHRLVPEAGGGSGGGRELGPRLRREVVGPQVAEHGRAVAAAEEDRGAAVTGDGPGVILARRRPRQVEARPCQWRRLGSCGRWAAEPDGVADVEAESPWERPAGSSGGPVVEGVDCSRRA